MIELLRQAVGWGAIFLVVAWLVYECVHDTTYTGINDRR